MGRYTKLILCLFFLTHLGIKLFGCDFCQKRFASNVGLKEHIARHTDTKSQICQICQRAFRQVRMKFIRFSCKYVLFCQQVSSSCVHNNKVIKHFINSMKVTLQMPTHTLFEQCGLPGPSMFCPKLH